MGIFSEAFGRSTNRDTLSLKSDGAEVASATQSHQELDAKAQMTILVTVSAVSGSSPTLLVTIEGSHDGVNWFTLCRVGSDGYVPGPLGTAPANIIATGTYRASCTATRFVRSKSTIGGSSPSFTYTVAGDTA